MRRLDVKLQFLLEGYSVHCFIGREAVLFILLVRMNFGDECEIGINVGRSQ